MKLPVASQCPFPVGCIFDSAKALFEAVVPLEMHKEAIYDGLEQGLALHIDWEPIREVAEIDGTNIIHLHANFCQFLWMLNYCMLIMEKARAFDPFGHAGFAPSGKIRMTP